MESKKFTPTVTITLDRYDELIEAEKKSVKEYPHTVLTYDSFMCSKYVQTDDVAVVKLAEDLKISIEKGKSYVKSIDNIKKMSILQFIKWRKNYGK